MNSLEILIAKMKKIMKQRKLTQEDVAKGTGVSARTINNVLNLKNASIGTLIKVIEFIEGCEE